MRLLKSDRYREVPEAERAAPKGFRLAREPLPARVDTEEQV
jgi:hypothetical protein